MSDIQWPPSYSYRRVKDDTKLIARLGLIPFEQPAEIWSRSRGINWKWRNPQTAHFYIDDAIRWGCRGHEIANKELSEVQCRLISYSLQEVVHVTPYAKEWRWSRIFPPEPNVQR